MLSVLLAANTRINIRVFAAIINHFPVCLKLIMGVSFVYILASGLYLAVHDFGKICDWKLEIGNLVVLEFLISKWKLLFKINFFL